MSAAGEQVFNGAAHRIRFLFQASSRPADALYVCFADAAPQPRLQYVDELAPLDVPRLHVLDDFGPYAGEAGYPGSWYLGERRRLTFADDIVRLVDHAAATHGVPSGQIAAVGFGAGGFAALHLALRNGWGRVIAGFPHTRLGRQLTGDLADVAAFVAGGTNPSDRRWLDGLLFEALAEATRMPQIELLSGGLNYGRHALPLMQAAEHLQAPIELTLATGGQQPEAMFAAHLIERIAELSDVPRLALDLDGDLSRHICPWSRRARAQLSHEADGLRCFAPATGKHDSGVYAGVRLDAGPIELARIELTLRRPGELDGMLVDALDAADQRVARWQWRFDLEPPTSGRMSVLLSPADRFPVRAEVDGDLSRAAKLDVFVRLKPERSADFTVHRVEVVSPSGSPPPAPGLELPAARDAATGARRLRDHAAVARQVAALAAEGTFPPSMALPEPRPRRELKVACLLDHFSELCFRNEFHYVDFTPDDYREVIDRERPDMLFVESIWRGKDETWNKLMVQDSSGSGPAEPIIDLVRHCRSRGIPTVFWNKEDPPNFEHFVHSTPLFDYVFTTDESCVPRYRAVLDHDRIGVLPFAAQTAIHNPLGAPVQRPLDVAFLGTFYGLKHAARKRQMEMILDPAREFGVHIYSRVEALGGYAFPDKYVPHLIGTVPYEQVLGAYRTYKVLLNVNSVPDSKTMCARRVFEILGCGGAVVSGPSPAIEASLGPGVVHESDSYGHTREILEHVLSNDALRERCAIEGVRRVNREHTYSHRVDTILATVGLSAPVLPDTVALVAAVDSDEQAREIVETAVDQSRRPEELVLVATPGTLDPGRHVTAAGRAGIRLTVRDGDPHASTAACLADALSATSSELVGSLVTSAIYGRHYLEDLVAAGSQSSADILGKGAHYRFDRDRGWLAVERRHDEHRFVDAVHPGAMLAHRRAFTRVPLSPSDELDSWQRRCAERGLRIYASDRFNFAVQDRGEASAFVETFGTGPQHALA
jgi:hypothetical protein